MIVGPDNVSYMKLADRFEKLQKGLKPSINVSAILDVWENEGIEKAIDKQFSEQFEESPKTEALYVDLNTILDVWENEGIDKAIKLYEKVNDNNNNTKE